jgi:hypothetical protein
MVIENGVHLRYAAAVLVGDALHPLVQDQVTAPLVHRPSLGAFAKFTVPESCAVGDR